MTSMSDAEVIREKMGTVPNETVIKFFSLLRAAGCHMDIERIELRVFPADGSEYAALMSMNGSELRITPFTRQ